MRKAAPIAVILLSFLLLWMSEFFGRVDGPLSPGPVLS